MFRTGKCLITLPNRGIRWRNGTQAGGSIARGAVAQWHEAKWRKSTQEAPVFHSFSTEVGGAQSCRPAAAEKFFGRGESPLKRSCWLLDVATGSANRKRILRNKASAVTDKGGIRPGDPGFLPMIVLSPASLQLVHIVAGSDPLCLFKSVEIEPQRINLLGLRFGSEWFGRLARFAGMEPGFSLSRKGGESVIEKHSAIDDLPQIPREVLVTARTSRPLIERLELPFPAVWASSSGLTDKTVEPSLIASREEKVIPVHGENPGPNGFSRWAEFDGTLNRRKSLAINETDVKR